MRYIARGLSVLLLSVAAGCATFPSGPSVTVLPAPGKSFDKFQAEDATCRNWAERQLGTSPQETHDQKVATGAAAGTAMGAGVGAALGSVSGHAGAGALIGAAYGLVAGSAVGASAGESSGRQAQRRYDNAYQQCMYSYGNQIPGYRKASSAPRVAAPPPVAAPEDYPPQLVFDEAPQFIYEPETNVYVAVGVPYDLVWDGRGYYYFYGGRWYRGANYYGPWGYTSRGRSAPGFVRYRVDYIRSHRDAEYRRYERDRSHYDGRFHRPAYRGRPHKDESRFERR